MVGQVIVDWFWIKIISTLIKYLDESYLTAIENYTHNPTVANTELCLFQLQSPLSRKKSRLRTHKHLRQTEHRWKRNMRGAVTTLLKRDISLAGLGHFCFFRYMFCPLGEIRGLEVDLCSIMLKGEPSYEYTYWQYLQGILSPYSIQGISDCKRL